MATIDLGEGNKFIITKTHEEISTMLEELRALEEKYPILEVKEIKLPESEEKDPLIDIEEIDIEQTETKPIQTKRRIGILRKQKKQQGKTFSDDEPEFIELYTTPEQNMIEINKAPQQTVYENLTEWEEVQPEKSLQAETTTEILALESEPNLSADVIGTETPEIKEHRVRTIPGTNIKLIIDEEGNLILADKPKTIIKKKVKIEKPKEKKIKKLQLKNIIPRRKQKE